MKRLVMEGLIENRGEPGKDSLFILDGRKKDPRVTVNDEDEDEEKYVKLRFARRDPTSKEGK